MTIEYIGYLKKYFIHLVSLKPRWIKAVVLLERPLKTHNS